MLSQSFIAAAANSSARAGSAGVVLTGEHPRTVQSESAEHAGHKMIDATAAAAVQPFTDRNATPMSTPPGMPEEGRPTFQEKRVLPKENTETARNDGAGTPTVVQLERDSTMTRDSLVSPRVTEEGLAPVKSGKRFVNYESLHTSVLDVITPKPRVISKYSYAGICKPLNPDPLGMAPYGVRTHSCEFVESAFDLQHPTMPKFLVAVVGSFPTLGRDFHKKIYSEWKETRKGVSDICSNELTDNEGINLRLLLDEVVTSRALVTRKFISAASALYKGKDTDKLPNVVGPWIKPFFSDVDKAVERFLVTLEQTRALANEAPVQDEIDTN